MNSSTDKSGPNLPLIAAAVLVLLLGSLNLYQWKTRPAPPEPPTRDEVIAQYAEIAFFPVMTGTFLGIQTWQNPNDLWVTLEIMAEVKPDFIVETGTHRGGSAALWAIMLEHINPNGRVVSIDIEDKAADARKLPIVKRKVDLLVGSSTDPAILAEVKRIVGDGKVMVILDSDHSRDHVLRELELYSPLVDVGSYLIVQDSAANGHPLMPDHGPGPWEAMDAFLPTAPHFVSDRGRERYGFTLNPRGFLKRTR